MNISMSIPGSSSNRLFSDDRILRSVSKAPGVSVAIRSRAFLSSGERSVIQKAVQGSVGLEYHPDVGVRLFGCRDFAPMYVVETGTHVLYQSAVGTQGHVYQGLLVGNLFASGSEKHLGTALLRVAGNVGHVCTAGIVQTGQKSAKNGVFFLDESLEVTTVVYAVVQGSGKQLTICDSVCSLLPR